MHPVPLLPRSVKYLRTRHALTTGRTAAQCRVRRRSPGCAAASCRFLQGQPDSESRALLDSALDLDHAGMVGHNTIRYGKPQARPTVIGTGRKERLENAFQV